MEKINGKYRIPSNRLQNFDYGSHALYFVTLCTKNRKCYFGDISLTNPDWLKAPSIRVETHDCASLQEPTFRFNLTPIGEIAINCWNQIPVHFPFVELDEFAVMQDHIHGILFFNKPLKDDWKPNQFGPQSKNLGSVIRAFKSSVKRIANQNNMRLEWQSRYHDRILWNHKALSEAREYVRNNLEQWNFEAKCDS